MKFRFELSVEEDGFALYSAPSPGPAPAFVYFLLLPGAGDPPPTLILSEAWEQPGTFLFSAAQLAPKPVALATALGLAPPYATTRGVAWIASSAGASRSALVRLIQVAPNSGQTGADARLTFGNVELFLPSMTAISLSDDPPQAVFNNAGIALQRADNQGAPLAPDAFRVVLSFDPASPGAFSFNATWDPYNLFGLFADDQQSAGRQGGELRYFYPDANAPCGYQQLRYPVLAALPDEDWPCFALACEMAPLAPFDGARTRFIFQQQDLSHLASSFASTVSGEPVTLTPRAAGVGARAGFYPAARPGLGAATAAYLAPLGPFVIGVAGGAAKLMCGTAGTEFLRVADGDVLEFVPSRPARSASFGSDTGARAARTMQANGATQATLDATFNTSWVRFQPGAALALRGYYAQPGASVNFGRGTLAGAMNYPAAVSSLISTLAPDASNAPPPVFPLVPYGGVFALADAAVQDGSILGDFEKQVLAPLRGSRIGGATPAHPVFASEAGTPLSGSGTSTPQGMLVKLNDAPSPVDRANGGPTPAAGTWHKLVLARSFTDCLSFDADTGTGVVNARLASTLMREQLFMVLNDWARFPNITRTLAVAGFNFEIAPGPGDADPRSTVLVFKYATTLSLADLIHSPDQWAEAEYFVGGAAHIANAQQTLATALAVANDAKRDPDDPFGDFRRLANDPAWTGMLAFNAPINGNGMPADLQMIFAGIDAPLKAHNFGVQVNRIRDSGDAVQAPEISESSLFGVIYYGHGTPARRPRPAAAADAAGDTGYTFSVYELAVAISNSAVTQFHCRVGMTIDKLFGREVSLVAAHDAPGIPANTVVVAGQYQRTGEVGTIIFNAAQNGQFLFNPDRTSVRVLEAFSITGASLVPVASQPSRAAAESGSTVHARFALDGELAFTADPFPGVEGLDLYSYGRQGDAGATPGVPLSGLAFGLTCELDDSGQRRGPPTIVPDLAGLRAVDNPKAQRQGALVRMLPLKLNSIMHDEKGLDAKALGAMVVHVPDLMSVGVAIPGAGAGNAVKTQASYVTSRPLYALQFALPLGSLGALADTHASLDASLVVAWGPSSFTPDDDGAALFVQLPQVSAGAFGFNLQGLLKTTFGDANLGLVQTKAGPAYVLLFNNVALSVLGITMPPKVITDFILFGDARNPGAGSIGWSLAATQIP